MSRCANDYDIKQTRHIYFQINSEITSRLEVDEVLNLDELLNLLQPFSSNHTTNGKHL